MPQALQEKVQEPVDDGRRQRTERTKIAIMDAVLALMSEGVLVPTAQQVADRAGIGLRTYFRRFKHQDALLDAIDEYAGRSYESLIEAGDRSGNLQQRVDNVVSHYGRIYEASRHVMLGTKAILWRSKVAQRNYARVQRHLRRDLLAWLPELKSLSATDQEAAHALVSAEMWLRLRDTQKLSNKKAVAAIAMLLTQLVERD